MKTISSQSTAILSTSVLRSAIDMASRSTSATCVPSISSVVRTRRRVYDHTTLGMTTRRSPAKARRRASALRASVR